MVGKPFRIIFSPKSIGISACFYKQYTPLGLLPYYFILCTLLKSLIDTCLTGRGRFDMLLTLWQNIEQGTPINDF